MFRTTWLDWEKSGGEEWDDIAVEYGKKVVRLEYRIPEDLR